MVKDDVMAVYQLISEAESKVHGVPVTEIHFHEVGTMDAVADVTTVCLLMENWLLTRSLSPPSMWAAAMSTALTAFCQCQLPLQPIFFGMCLFTAGKSRASSARLPVLLS